MTWIIYPLVFLAGFIDSIAGGGGLISLASYAAIGLPMHLALGTNKFSSSFGTLISSARFAKNGYVRLDSVISAFTGSLIGSAMGANIVMLIDEIVLKYMLMILVPLVAVFMIFKKDFGETKKNLPRSKVIIYSFLIGVGIGMYDGFFGPGTGTFLIMCFSLIIGLDIMVSCGNAKFVNLASNLAAVVTFILHGQVNYKLAVPCAVCGILGNYIGSGLTMKKGSKIVRPMMIIVILLLLIKIVTDLFAG